MIRYNVTSWSRLMENFITAGEFAKLAATSKRTILFYDEKGVLKPVRIGTNNYRYYSEQQILEYQMILLMTTHGITLKEIRQHVVRKGNLADLFNQKKELIQNQIHELQFSFDNIKKFTTNIKKNGTMVNPVIKTLQPFPVLYIEKVGAYSGIGMYCSGLVDMLNAKTAPTALAVFEELGYRPKKSKIKIGVIARPGITVKRAYANKVKRMLFGPGKVITYTHNGPGETLSLFWKELEKYCALHRIIPRTDVPDFEIYRTVHSDPSKQFFEIYLPIK